MFRTIGDGPSPWESLLPPELLRLPAELARVDALLDDPVFFAPFVPHFHPVIGRPSTLLTVIAAALLVHVAFGLAWYVALLVATAVAPTDPAVVFSVLGQREASGRAGIILKGESGANDPVDRADGEPDHGGRCQCEQIGRAHV